MVITIVCINLTIGSLCITIVSVGDDSNTKLEGKVASEILVGGKMPPRWERAARMLAAGGKPKKVRLDCFMSTAEWKKMGQYEPWRDHYILARREEKALHYEVRRQLVEQALDAPATLGREMRRPESDPHFNANRSVRVAEALLVHSGTSAPKQVKTAITHKFEITPEQGETIEATWEEIKGTVSLDTDVEPEPNQRFSI